MITLKSKLKKGMKIVRRAWNLSDFKQLSCAEILLCIFMMCATPAIILLTSKLILLFVYFTLFAIALYLAIWHHIHKKEKIYPKYYKLLLILYLIVSIVAFYSLLTPNLNAAGYGYVLGFFVFLAAVYISLIYISNFFYLLVLKQIFPSEKEKIENTAEDVSLKELSNSIDLDKQKHYLNITILNIFLSTILVGYFTLFIMKKTYTTEDAEQVRGLMSFYHWLDNQKSITLFNGISLLSVVITLYVLTFSAQDKIFDDAKKKHNES